VCTADLNDIGVGEAREALVLADDPGVLIMCAVTVPPAPGGTFCYPLLSPSAAQIVQPDAAYRRGEEGRENKEMLRE
jgi:hypothetical protein